MVSKYSFSKINFKSSLGLFFVVVLLVAMVLVSTQLKGITGFFSSAAGGSPLWRLYLWDKTASYTTSNNEYTLLGGNLDWSGPELDYQFEGSSKIPAQTPPTPAIFNIKTIIDSISKSNTTHWNNYSVNTRAGIVFRPSLNIPSVLMRASSNSKGQIDALNFDIGTTKSIRKLDFRGNEISSLGLRMKSDGTTIYAYYTLPGKSEQLMATYPFANLNVLSSKDPYKIGIFVNGPHGEKAVFQIPTVTQE